GAEAFRSRRPGATFQRSSDRSDEREGRESRGHLHHERAQLLGQAVLPPFQRGARNSQLGGDLDLRLSGQEAHPEEFLLGLGHFRGQEPRQHVTRLQGPFAGVGLRAQPRGGLAAGAAKMLERLQPRNLTQPGRQRSTDELGAERSIPQQRGPVLEVDGSNHAFVAGVKCPHVNPCCPVRLHRLYASRSLCPKDPRNDERPFSHSSALAPCLTSYVVLPGPIPSTFGNVLRQGERAMARDSARSLVRTPTTRARTAPRRRRASRRSTDPTGSPKGGPGTRSRPRRFAVAL